MFLRERPTGMPSAANFDVEEQTITGLPDEHVLVKVDTLSIDAFIGTTLNEDSFHASTPVGGTITALGVGEVVASNFDGLQPGDWVNGPLLAQTYTLMPGAAFQKIEPRCKHTAQHLSGGTRADHGPHRVGRPGGGW